MTKLLRGAFATFALLGTLLVPGVARADIPDADLARQVVEVIQRYSRFSMFDDVKIAVDNRVVTLTGAVTGPLKKDEIGTRVAKLDGVRSLVNDIRVLPLSPFDDDLRVRAARAIYNHPQFWGLAGMLQPPIHIIVDRGHIKLTGRVGTDLDKALAYALAQVPGSFSVTNELKVDKH